MGYDMANFYVLDTEQQATECINACFTCWMDEYRDLNGYDITTNTWYPLRRRATDSKYIVVECDCYDNSDGYSLEAFSESWLPYS